MSYRLQRILYLIMMLCLLLMLFLLMNFEVAKYCTCP